MIPTPQDVLPVIERTIAPLNRALTRGLEFADDLQPDTSKRDPWFWAHAARYRARKHLATEEKDGWALVRRVPNSGIHLRVDDIHKMRVLRTLHDSVPHPGSNSRRREDYSQGVQGVLLLGNDGTLEALSLIADWHIVAGEPQIYISLPKRPWDYLSDPEVYWRVRVTGDASSDLAKLSFDPQLPSGDVVVKLKIDPSERRDAL